MVIAQRLPRCVTSTRAIYALIASVTTILGSYAWLNDGHETRTNGVGWAASVSPRAVANPVFNTRTRIVSFDTTEGTLMNVDVAPSGDVLAFDLLGDIYWIPMEGGTATPLTVGSAWDQAPRYSPDGRFIYFVSDREGFKNLWRLTLADKSLVQVTVAESDIVGTPNWSQSGRHLLAGVGDAQLSNSEITLWLIDPNNGDMVPLDAPKGPWLDLETFETLRPPIRVFSGAQSASGETYYSQVAFDKKIDRTTNRIYKFDPRVRIRTELTHSDSPFDDYKPLLSHDGSLLAYFRQYSDRQTEIRVRHLDTGIDKPILELEDADDSSYNSAHEATPGYAFTPDNECLIFWHGGKIHRVNLSNGTREIIPFRVNVEREVNERAQQRIVNLEDARYAQVIRWPSISRDGQRMAFSAIGYVWVMNLGTGSLRRVTRSSDFEYMPTISPDGESIAYVSFAKTGKNIGSGRLMVVDLNEGDPRELLATAGTTYLLPKWSQDGKKIAVIREAVDRSNGGAAFGWTAAAEGKFHEVAIAPTSSDRPSYYTYARFVGFDATGRNVLFSYPRSSKETVLAMVDLVGEGRKTLATGTSEVGGITPAPDLANVALTRRDRTVWLVPFDADMEEQPVSTLSPEAHRISTGGAYYLDWTNVDRVTYGFGQDVYRYALGAGAPEALTVKVPNDRRDDARTIAFKGARLITMSQDDGIESVIESGTIVLSDRRITAIGPVREVVPPPEAIVINATGKTIMPGLLDTHYHRIGGPSLSGLMLPNAKFDDDSAIAYGVTTAWEPGGAAGDGVPAAVDLQRAGRITGPRWSHSVEARVGYPWGQLTTYAAALAAVEQHKALGVAVLKEVETPTRQQRRWLSTAANENGLGIVSHIESFDGMMTRIVDGFTGGEHSYIPVPFFRDVHEMLRQTGYIWTPNIVITTGSLGAGSDVNTYFWQDVLKQRPQEQKKLSTITSAGDFSQSTTESPRIPYKTHRVSRVAQQAAYASINGVHIGVSAHNMPGINLHREMWYLWRGGLPAHDVLRAATIGNAEKLGFQEEIGSLEPGKRADILVLEENPLDDISNTLSIKFTIMDGVVYRGDSAERVETYNLSNAAVAAGN